MLLRGGELTKSYTAAAVGSANFEKVKKFGKLAADLAKFMRQAVSFTLDMPDAVTSDPIKDFVPATLEEFQAFAIRRFSCLVSTAPGMPAHERGTRGLFTFTLQNIPLCTLQSSNV